jgi:glycosyltransferase involved in cell wall biosynthesis
MNKELRNKSAADLHVHSKYSDRPGLWLLRRIGAPESFMEPLEIYRIAKSAGMDFFTITDHNTISGALDIAHLPGTFLSSELTTYFPDNGCKIHCVVNGITEKQFHEMMQLRENIYDLQAYMFQHQIVHSIAHPLYQINNRLTVDLVEKLILLFNRFEIVNGARDVRASTIFKTILDNLTPEIIGRLSDKHQLDPVGEQPWIKCYTGGSDDTSGLYIADAYTQTPKASTVIDFIQFLREGEHNPCGVSGNSVRLANGLYRIAYQYYKERFIPRGAVDHSLIGHFLQNLSHRSADQTNENQTLGAKIKKKMSRKVQEAYVKAKMGDIEQMLAAELIKIMDQNESIGGNTLSQFQSASRISQELSYLFFEKALLKIKRGELVGALQAFSSLFPVGVGVMPYLTAFKSQHRDEAFLNEICNSFSSVKALQDRGGGIAWISDTFEDVNGVTNTIRTLADIAQKQGKAITVITSLEEDPVEDFPLRNFKPIGSFSLPEYESIKMSFPPFLDLLYYLEKEQFDEIIISTPGTLGICGLTAAHILGIRVKGIYHTDFPRFFEDISEDERLGELTWRYMQWFYGRMEKLLVPTFQYKAKLIAGGFNEKNIQVMPRGINHDKFNVSYREEQYWQKYGLGDAFTFIYVGRISREKNVETLLEAFHLLSKRSVSANLVIVGDGPLRKDLEKYKNQKGILFTGYLYNDDLARAYASSDAFVFPSRTDTFGNVVLEAHACGLPAIVSDEGGPQEIVGSHESGLIVNMRNASCLADAMEQIIRDKSLSNRLKDNASKKVMESTWEAALEKL